MAGSAHVSIPMSIVDGIDAYGRIGGDMSRTTACARLLEIALNPDQALSPMHQLIMFKLASSEAARPAAQVGRNSHARVNVNLAPQTREGLRQYAEKSSITLSLAVSFLVSLVLQEPPDPKLLEEPSVLSAHATLLQRAGLQPVAVVH